MADPACGRLLGSGNGAEIFESGLAVLKLYRPGKPKRLAFREAAALALVESLGLPVPQVLGVGQCGDRWGVRMTRVEGPSFADTMLHQPEQVAGHLQAMARIQGHVHGFSGRGCGSLKTRLGANIAEAASLDAARRHHLLDRLAAMPDGDRLCHGDFHPYNVLGQPDRASVIDWLDASQGDPAADVCRSYVLMRRAIPALAAQYLEAYAAVNGMPRERITAWLPFVAAARLAEDVPEEAAALMDMANADG